MITAQATTFQDYLHVVFSYPDAKEMTIDLPGYDHEALTNHARRIMYFENRKWILKKLTGWLKQRMYAFQVTDRARCNMDAAKLIVLLGYYENGGFFKLCSLIADHREAIEALAPRETSSHYGAYTKTILPMLKFCEEMKGGCI